MKMVQVRFCIVLLIIVGEGILAAQDNITANVTSVTLDLRKKFKDTRRNHDHQKKKKGRSTSSSSRSLERKGTDEKSRGESKDESLDLSTELASSDNESKKKNEPKSSGERKGWRKWHRKCFPCPEEMGKKWRDPSIKWICGAYQRAQRSFKSLCMMHYRNCQDGTMFTKIHDHRCVEDRDRAGEPHGDHFFYDYVVHLTGESTRSMSSDETSVSHVSGEGNDDDDEGDDDKEQDAEK
ncbi:uncharacterized protein LOC128678078 [Plodia interpunctella]|uniref:uncharacterized protein LOC128678078 n=1 Tax=Plodia interpunctella TaxID=58824 RepID=UPI002367BDE4|nr:uncharacterized protein LOC128678078 [Plodia interpunctella]